MKTYLFSGTSGYDWSSFEEILSANGFSPYPDGEYVKDGKLLLKDGACGIKYVDFLSVELITEHGYDTNTYGISCDWHSRHTGDSMRKLIAKDMLHELLRNSSFIAKTYALEEFQYVSGVYILRPSNILLSSGIDIMIVNSAEAFRSAREFYEKRISAHSKYHNKSLQYYRVIVSEYIAAPLLFQGRKFHLRLYGINFSDRSGFWISTEHGKILTAATPFILGDFGNKNIHDTHMDSTDDDYFYPEDFPRQDLVVDINLQLDKLAEELAQIADSPKTYVGAKRSFHVYGLDIMVNEAGRIILLEINDRVGFDPKKGGAGFADFCAKHAKWLASFLRLNI